MDIALGLSVSHHHQSYDPSLTPPPPPPPPPPSDAGLLSVGVLRSDGPTVSGSGTFAEMVLDGTWTAPVVDPSKVTVTCQSPGHSDGVATTVNRSIACLAQRHWHARADAAAGHNDLYVSDDGNGNTVVHVVLASPVYAGDTNTRVVLQDGWVTDSDGRSGAAQTLTFTNTSDEPYPPVIAKWATEDRRPLLLRNSTFEVCAHAAHAFDDEMAGKRRPCDGVIFTITNGVTTITRTITEITNSTYADEMDAYLNDVFGANFGTNSDTALTVSRPAGIPASPVFACTVDLAAEGFAIGNTITVTAEALPFLGDAGTILPSDGTDPEFTAQTHKILGTNRAYVYVDQSLSGVVTGPSDTAFATMTEALANPNSEFRYAIERANNWNGGTNDGVVVLVKPDATGGLQLGAANSRVGLAGKPTVIENDVVVMEILPAPGVDLSACELRRNQRGGAGSGEIPGGCRAYGFQIDPEIADGPLKANNGTAPDNSYVAVFPSGGRSSVSPGTSAISNARHFIMGGDFATASGSLFNPLVTVRGVKIGDGGGGQNTAVFILGSDINSFPLLTEVQTSGIFNDRKMRWYTQSTTTGSSIVSGAANTEGFSVLGCAVYAGLGGGSGTSGVLNADGNTNALQHARIAMSALVGDRRINAQYDHEATPSGPKWANELFGSVVATYNHKRPHWGIGRSDGVESDHYRWGAADAHFYGVGKAYNVIFGSSSNGAFTPGAYVGPQRYRGTRYGMPFGGEPAEAGFPEPWADPENGDWSVLDDAAWQALPSTGILSTSALRDPQEDYTTNLVTGVVPASRVPVPFDLYGTPYPETGFVEAGPVMR